MEKQEFMEKAATMLYGIFQIQGASHIFTVVLSSLSPYTKNTILTMQETTMR